MAPTMERSAPTSSPKLDKERCDICQMKNNYRALTLLQCRRCHIFVHRECYHGVVTAEESDEPFECLACLAIGTSISGRRRKGGAKVETITLVQKERPTECCLCRATGLHAMHPLYDHSGKKGRQIVLPKQLSAELPERLAWVHSLCAYVVCFLANTAGCVYGCNRRGQFIDDKSGAFTFDDEFEDDQLSTNSKLEQQRGKGDMETIHHFGYCLPTPQNQPNQWTQKIEINQKTLKCTICGHADDPKRSYRIPVQCRANEDNEHENFRHSHTELECTENCTQAMHVGCAMWGYKSDHPDVRRVFYYPGGQDGGSSEPVAEVYCNAHAMDVKRYRDKAKGVLAAPRQKSGSLVSQRSLPPPLNRTYKTRENTVDDGELTKRPLKGVRVRNTKTATVVPRPTANAFLAAAGRKRTTPSDSHPNAQRARVGSGGTATSKSSLTEKHQISTTSKSSRTEKRQSSTTPATKIAPAAFATGMINMGHSPTTAPRSNLQATKNAPATISAGTINTGRSPTTVSIPGRANRALNRQPSLTKYAEKITHDAAPNGRGHHPLSSAAFHPEAATAAAVAAAAAQKLSDRGHHPSSLLLSTSFRRTSSTETHICRNHQAGSSTHISPKNASTEPQRSVAHSGLSPTTCPIIASLNSQLSTPIVDETAIQQPSSNRRSGEPKKRAKHHELLNRDEALPLIHDRRGKLAKPRQSRRDDYYGPPGAEKLVQSHTGRDDFCGPSEIVGPAQSDDHANDDDDDNEEVGKCSAPASPTSTTPELPTLWTRPTVDAGVEEGKEIFLGDDRIREPSDAHMDASQDGIEADKDDSDEFNVCGNPEVDEGSDSDEPPGRWDHLIQGPHYTGVFKFGEWDKCKRI